MDFCREMGWTHFAYRAHPARLVLRWRAFIGAQRAGEIKHREIERMKAEVRGRRH